MIKTVKLGMPQLNYNGLDEVWLLKELGNIHWNMLGELKTKQRYYASFFNVQVSYPQSTYHENEDFNIRSEIYRFNNKIYRSKHSFSKGFAILDSIFVRKENDKLVKSDEVLPSIGKKVIKDINISDHQKLKKQVSQFTKTDHKLDINPQLMFNGVRILYFANYVHMAQQCEWLTYKKILPPIVEIKANYFGNTSIKDTVYGRTIHNKTALFANDSCIAQIKIIREGATNLKNLPGWQ